MCELDAVCAFNLHELILTIQEDFQFPGNPLKSPCFQCCIWYNHIVHLVRKLQQHKCIYSTWGWSPAVYNSPHLSGLYHYCILMPVRDQFWNWKRLSCKLLCDLCYCVTWRIKGEKLAEILFSRVKYSSKVKCDRRVSCTFPALPRIFLYLCGQFKHIKCYVSSNSWPTP